MEGSSWLRVAIIGLVLSAIVLGYFLVSGRFLPKFRSSATTSQTVQPTMSPQAEASDEPVLGENTEPKPINPSAYTRIAQRSQGNIKTLPKTGSPLFLIATILLSLTVTGWGLRKFPY